MKGELLVILAKYPTPGKVKTRLARDIGAAAAARVYRRLIEAHACEFQNAPFDVEWRYTPAHAPFRRLLADRYPVVTQPGGDLGERIHRIFDDSFSRGYRRVIVIGSDAPDMSVRTVCRGFAGLKLADVILQPTEDGGYSLVGLTISRDLFSGIPWSTSRVMESTRRKITAMGCSLIELPITYDVDTLSELTRAAAAHPELL